MASTSLKVKLVKRIDEAQDIASFELAPSDGQPLPAFSAGSHIDVTTSEGIVRQYSLCNEPSETHRYLIAVLKEPHSRGGSKYMHEQLREGDELEISAPKNRFALAHDAPFSLLLAGGIGITPLLCMAERLDSMGSQFEMHYLTRSVARTAFRSRIKNSPFAAHVHFHHDDAEPSQKLELGELLKKHHGKAHLYFCGPPGFMSAVLDAVKALQWPEEQVHFEYFAGEPKSSGDTDSFEVQIASSGAVIVVQKDQTALEALSDAGVQIPSVCEEGVCGTCITRVLAGVPDHRDHCLTPAEQAANDLFTPCCSRAKSTRLVLDI
ncbi:PDR/VanB family oxidoreductase [Ottowia thiooxydans]|uniref:PDR/VanB family oxidoreductase n=1 Tax=Ottowia thiooxydans TaxID=219182 RepID=UPI003399999F